MDLNEIRQFIETEGGKFIIVEGGKPVMVVSSFEEYKNKVKLKPEKSNSRKIPKELEEEPLKIEDLPFK